MTKRTKEIIALLDQVYSTEYKCYLEHDSAWQLLIATILSAQCTDARVNIVTKDLFVKYPGFEAFAKENRLWKSLSVGNKKGIPVRAIFAHAVIATLIILTGSFKEIFVYTAFILQLFASLAISTVYFIKKEDRKIFKSNLF